MTPEEATSSVEPLEGGCCRPELDGFASVTRHSRIRRPSGSGNALIGKGGHDLDAVLGGDPCEFFRAGQVDGVWRVDLALTG